MKKIVISLTLFFFIIVFVISSLIPKEREESKLNLFKEKIAQKKAIVHHDHSRYDILKKKFNSPKEVTEACMTCHVEEAREVMKSNHWNWESPQYIKGRGVVYIGKKNAINNFCLGTEGNELACAKCHVGFGMTSSKTFNFKDSTNIDCLICHDNTETYAKAPEKGGAPVATLDLSFVAQNVGAPKRTNCGVCHFFGGGGNNVKHGDLEKSMFEPNKEIDVHMAAEGSNLTCVDCHITKEHNISGQMYSLASSNRNRVYCEECHTETPHEDGILNKHTLKVACQTCHIPIYAKVNATKTFWDWSTAAKLKNGKPYEEDDADGNHTYLSTKGSFKWGKKLKPEYIWFNGTASHYLAGDRIADTTQPLILNPLNGAYSDLDSKIIPVKVMITNQCFDPVYQILSLPKLFSPTPGEGAFWTDFNCLRALDVGMKEIGLPFSGKLSFIETKMNWPVNHMVSTKENSVKCNECHTQNHSRIAGVKGFYMPARDSNSIIETAGFGLILLSLLGVFVHGIVRIYSSYKLKKRG